MIKTTESGSVIANRSEGEEPINGKHIIYHSGKISITRHPNPIATQSTLQEILEVMESGSKDILVCSIESAVEVMQDHRWMTSVDAKLETFGLLLDIISEEA